MRVQPRTRPEEARCPYCREAVDAQPWECEGCGLRMHRDCAAESGGCATIGCAHKGRAMPPCGACGARLTLRGAIICLSCGADQRRLDAAPPELDPVRRRVGQVLRGERDPLPRQEAVEGLNWDLPEPGEAPQVSPAAWPVAAVAVLVLLLAGTQAISSLPSEALGGLSTCCGPWVVLLGLLVVSLRVLDGQMRRRRF